MLVSGAQHSDSMLYMCVYSFPGGIVVKNPPDNGGDTRDAGLTLDQEGPLEKEMAICSSILAWKIPWTEEPGRL